VLGDFERSLDRRQPRPSDAGRFAIAPDVAHAVFRKRRGFIGEFRGGGLVEGHFHGSGARVAQVVSVGAKPRHQRVVGAETSGAQSEQLAIVPTLCEWRQHPRRRLAGAETHAPRIHELHVGAAASQGIGHGAANHPGSKDQNVSHGRRSIA
jgi:hypothetical protein